MSDTNSLDKLILDSVVDKNSSDFNFQTIDGRKIFIENIGEFWKKIDFSFKNNKKELENIHLLESPNTEYSILRFDIDIYSEIKFESRSYSVVFVKAVIEYIHSLIRHLVVTKQCSSDMQDNNKLISCVFGKQTIDKKDGFHIIFPNLLCGKDLQNNYFVSKLKDNIYQLWDGNKNLKVKVDKVSTKPWVIHGTKKTDTSSLYSLENAYSYNIQQISSVPYDIPSLYSINRSDSRTKSYHLNIKSVNIKQYDSDYTIDSAYNEIVQDKLLYLLNEDRVNDYDDWLQIGLVLFNVGNGQARFLDLWKDWARDFEGFSEFEHSKKWSSFSVLNLTMGTLKYLVHCDNPTKYKMLLYKKNLIKLKNRLFKLYEDEDEEITDESIIEVLKNNTPPSNVFVAQIFYSLYKNTLLWSPTKRNSGKWYRFLKNKWVEHSPELILQLLTQEVTAYIFKLFRDLYDEMTYIDNKDIPNFIKVNVKNYQRSLGSNSFLTQTINQSKSNFVDEKFDKKKDMNKYLIGCENGVLDLKSFCFRKTVPEDYITLSTGLIYKDSPPLYNQQSFITEYFEQMFVDREQREDYLNMISACLLGGNLQKIVLFAYGHTNAGKSQIVTFLSKAIGDYTTVLPKEIIYNRKQTSSAARPELVKTQGRRLAFINELPVNETLNTAFIKEIAGNDKVFVRDLFSSGYDIETFFKLYISCNDMPPLPKHDYAMWGRIRIIKFESVFSDNAPKDKAEQIKQKTFPRCEDLSEKFDECAASLLYLLFERYKKNAKEFPNGIPCDYILKTTEEFKESTDPINRFIAEEVSEEKGSFVYLEDMFDKWKEWWRYEFPDQRIVKSKEMFRLEISHSLGKSFTKDIRRLKMCDTKLTNV
uniref:SF3 helicase domain-containing protein n=1 Tax=viral metagenome TaxID=1070528 RepID=A0A6C0JB10_9ZZZZ